jgi:hypothetical protein
MVPASLRREISIEIPRSPVSLQAWS